VRAFRGVLGAKLKAMLKVRCLCYIKGAGHALRSGLLRKTVSGAFLS